MQCYWASPLTRLQLKLIKIGARAVRHARAVTFLLAEAAITGPIVRAILAAICRLRAPPLCALPRSGHQLNESGKTGPSAALENGAAGPARQGFAVRSRGISAIADTAGGEKCLSSAHNTGDLSVKR